MSFLDSFAPISKRLKKYTVEIVLITSALTITVISLIIILKSNQPTENVLVEEDKVGRPSQKIMVEVAGAVVAPGVFEISLGARLKDMIDQAQGLSPVADPNYFARNFNLARYVTDQEKIYVPSNEEIAAGLFIENAQVINLAGQIQAGAASQTSAKNEKININSAALEELDTLPGVGEITAEKIISSRPYKTIDELITRKVVNKSVWEKIKDLIIN